MIDKDFIAFQEYIGKIKHLRRTGWVVRQVPNPETVAAHSWRMALMALHKAKELKAAGADVDRVVHICLLHDVGESVVGDIIPEIHQTEGPKISKEKKQQMENEAVQFLARTYHFPLLESAFNEYENQTTLEAKIVKNLDKLDMLLQAYEYISVYPGLVRLNEFMEHNEKDVNLALFADDVQEIKLRQFAHKKTDNKFIDDMMLADALKHKPYNPTKANIPAYDTVAAHLFRMAIMALYLGKFSALSVIFQNTHDDPNVAELEQLENVQQAYEYIRLYPKEKSLYTYVQQKVLKGTNLCYKI